MMLRNIPEMYVNLSILDVVLNLPARDHSQEGGTLETCKWRNPFPLGTGLTHSIGYHRTVLVIW